VEPRGGNGWQSVASHVAATKRRNREPLPSVATGCRQMVRRGSTVRVRQRASRSALQNGYLSCLSGKRLSRAGTRGHYLVFPRQAYRQVVFGLIKLIRTDLTPSVPRRDLAELARHIEMSGKGDAGVAHVQHGGDSFGENRWSVVGAQPKRRVRRERRARQGRSLYFPITSSVAAAFCLTGQALERQRQTPRRPRRCPKNHG
jgi:hypothetical protein